MNANADRIISAINELERYYWLDGLSASLSAIYRNYECPKPPEAAFGRTPRTLPFLLSSRLGNLGGYEHQALAAYNEGVISAYNCIGWKYVGLLTAIANETKGTANWNAYLLEAKEMIDNYFSSGNAFDEFDAFMLTPARKQLGLNEVQLSGK